MTGEELQALQRRVKRAISHTAEAERYARSAETHNDALEAGKARRAASEALTELDRVLKALIGLSAE